MNKQALFEKAIEMNGRVVIHFKDGSKLYGIANDVSSDNLAGVVFNMMGDHNFVFSDVASVELIISNPF